MTGHDAFGARVRGVLGGGLEGGHRQSQVPLRLVVEGDQQRERVLGDDRLGALGDLVLAQPVGDDGCKSAATVGLVKGGDLDDTEAGRELSEGVHPPEHGLHRDQARRLELVDECVHRPGEEGGGEVDLVGTADRGLGVLEDEHGLQVARDEIVISRSSPARRSAAS